MIDKLFPDIQIRANKLISTFKELHHLQLRITQGLRSFEDQEKLYERGRTQDGPVVTYSRGGYSFHNYGLAFDCAFVGSDPYLEKQPKAERDFHWKEYGRLAEIYGLEWGGRFQTPDRPHCQKAYGFDLHELRRIYQAYGIGDLWSVIDKKIKETIV